MLIIKSVFLMAAVCFLLVSGKLRIFKLEIFEACSFSFSRCWFCICNCHPVEAVILYFMFGIFIIIICFLVKYFIFCMILMNVFHAFLYCTNFLF